MQIYSSPDDENQLQLGLHMHAETLFVGDVLAIAAPGPSSATIRWTTNGQYSHAMLYVGDGWVVDAMPKGGVDRRALKNCLVQTSFAAVFRHRTATKVQLAHATEWARAQIGKRYDFVAAASAGLSSGARTHALQYTGLGHLIVEFAKQESRQGYNDTAFMCSELVFRAFEMAGAPITSAPVYRTSPGALLRTRELVYMGDLKRAAT